MLHDRHSIEFSLSFFFVDLGVMFFEMGDVFWMDEVFLLRIFLEPTERLG